MIYKRTLIWLFFFTLLSNGIRAEEYVITLKAPKTLHKLLAVKVGNRSLQQIIDSKIKHKFSFGKFEAITVEVPPIVADLLMDNKLVSHVSLNEEYNLLDYGYGFNSAPASDAVRYVYDQPAGLSRRIYCQPGDDFEGGRDEDSECDDEEDDEEEEDDREEGGGEEDEEGDDESEDDEEEEEEDEDTEEDGDGEGDEEGGDDRDIPTGPEEPEMPREPEEPEAPKEPEEPEIPKDPEEPEEPNQQPTRPSSPRKPKPAKPIIIPGRDPVLPVRPVVPVKPAKPHQPLKPGGDNQPGDGKRRDKDIGDRDGGGDGDNETGDDWDNHNGYATQYNAPRHLARNCRRSGLPFDTSGGGSFKFNYYYDSEHLGENVNVYVLDSGIYKKHPEFEGRALFGIDTTSEGPGDLNGHGTHVAGLVGSKTYGAAKKATLYEVKVMTVDGRGSTSNIISGVEFAVKHCQLQAEKRCVVNMSLGGLSFGHSALDSAVEAAIDEGLVFVVAAGNSKERACWYSPAKVKSAITVGAFDDRSDIIASFSNYGKCVDIFAPGVAVVSLSNSPYNTLRVLNGTSMSAPITAGVVAVLLDQGVHPDDVKDRLIELSTKGVFHKRRLVSSRTPDRTLFNGVHKDDDAFDATGYPFEDEDTYIKFIGDDFKKVQGPSLFRKVLKSSLSKVI
ncbi:HER180Cp [Eremothecium sinecaudum]|uniref:HER180Cp n=1 Tax=Eremothecium sinecaudum TaxID=45286 RepID=A0A0X8HU26_9SACH|nr:HER180Cp [Eremothecium sinecaudum]AMD21459.1 HER180Cp [Eremothecium sinecaudum]